ncbi:MAG: beta-ketoacyl synthase N-terminal-like domain-containing protein, partial [Planctomycetota bacterium]
EMGVAVSQKALTHSGLGADRVPERCGCLFGCDYILTRPEEYQDGLRNCRENGAAPEAPVRVGDWPEHGLNKVNPLWLLKYLPNMPNSHVSIYNEFLGPNNAITDRDASMNLAISEATSIIQRGAADVMLVGATGSRLHPLRTPQMILLEQLAKEQDDPAKMARPFDQSSDGMVLGEGAGAIVLESLEHAERRSAKIWGEILGCGAAMATNAERGNNRDSLATGIHSAASKALAGLPESSAKWHYHAQGLGTQQADLAEAAAINTLCEAHTDLTVTAAKSYFGNLGAGSAAVELICSLLALEHGALFPILNLETPLEGNRWTAATSGSPAGNAALHMSFTMEGQVSATLVGKA